MNNEVNIPNQYKPLSAWAYVGYNILFAIPLVGFILLIVFAFDNSNLVRRNYARSFFVAFVVALILLLIILALTMAMGAGAASTY